MKKRILACMLIIAMVGIGVVFAAEASDTIENLTTAANEDTVLNLTWDFNDTKETYKVGFSSQDPGADLSSKIYTDTLEITPFGNNNDALYKGTAETWVYWDIYTNKAFKIEMSASGPLKTGVGTSSETFKDLINWTAKWTECEVLATGVVRPKSQAESVIGKVGNNFGSMTTADESGVYGGTIPAEYTTPQVVYSQTEAKYDAIAKKGSAKVSIETQNTRAEDVGEGSEKIAGAYAASLKLKISTT